MAKTLDQLRLMRERMADPDRVVLDSTNSYERADGKAFWGLEAYDEDPPRACLIGWAMAIGDRRLADQIMAAAENVGNGTYTGALRAGRHLEVIDLAIAREEGR